MTVSMAKICLVSQHSITNLYNFTILLVIVYFQIYTVSLVLFLLFFTYWQSYCNAVDDNNVKLKCF